MKTTTKQKSYRLPKPTVTVDDGFYAEANADATRALTRLVREEVAPPEFVDMARERFMARYRINDATCSVGMRQLIDEFARESGTLNWHLNYLQQAAGKTIMTLGDFYTIDSTVTALFPAWIENVIQQARIAAGLVNRLIFSTTQASSEKVSVVYDSSPSTQRTLSKIGPGAELPRATLTVADSNISLHKFGRAISAPYEVTRAQNIDVLANHIARIARQVSVDETDEALDILVGGDGTTAGAAESDTTDVDVATSGTVAYSDLVSWVFGMDIPYRIDMAVFGDTDLIQIENLAEFKSSDSRIADQVEAPDPRAVRYLRWDGGVTGSSYVDRLGVGIDSTAALERYEWGGFLQEQDKIISRQVNVWTFSY